MRYFLCPICKERMIFPLIDDHFREDHNEIWKSFQESHFTNFSEFLYNYLFTSHTETCKRCGSKTDFLSVMKGYDQICFWCKNNLLHQKCLVCGTYVPFPQLDSHVRTSHSNFQSVEDMYRQVDVPPYSEPKSCIVCGSPTTFYSFGFCPLCDVCCRLYSAHHFGDIIAFWEAHFGRGSKALAMLAKLGPDEVKRRQKLLDRYRNMDRVVNGYPFYLLKDYVEEVLKSLARRLGLTFKPDERLELQLDGRSFIFTFFVPDVGVAIDLISWEFSPRVTAKKAVDFRGSLDEHLNFRKRAYNLAQQKGVSVIAISVPEFLIQPNKCLSVIENYFTGVEEDQTPYILI